LQWNFAKAIVSIIVINKTVFKALKNYLDEKQRELRLSLLEENLVVRPAKKFVVGFEIICKRYNHSSPAITMRYLGIEDKEVHGVLMNEIG
jgi:hypothetical protein